MNFNLKNILKFNHIKGKIEFTPNKLQDLLIVPTIDNIRQIGKVLRYWILWNIYGVGAKKIFGSTYFALSNKNLFGLNDKTIYKARDEFENEMITTDIISGTFVYITVIFIIKKIIFTIVVG